MILTRYWVVGKRIDSVSLGSCTNGRLEDFVAVAEIVKGKKIASPLTVMQGPAEYLVDVGYYADMEVHQTTKDELEYEKE